MERKFQLVLRLLLIGLNTTVCLPPAACAQEQTPQDEVYELRKAHENGITAPKPIYHPDPEYTDSARKKKISGGVVLSLVVTPEGTVRDPKITSSLDKDLDQQALTTVSTWKFEPATKDGRPVAVRISVEVSFRIR
jgi:TonB family protein